MDILTNYIKKTEIISDFNDIPIIIEYINQNDITINNLHLILKLISNLITYPNLINFNIDSIFDKYKNLLTDSHVILFIKINCSIKYNNPEFAIQLTNIYSVHKTSSYIPIFEYLILTKNYVLIKKLYLQFSIQNNNIINSNRKIKESNYKTRLYNDNIKLLKKKYLELNIIINTIKDIKLDNNPYSSNIEYNKLSFDEFKHKTEQNQIQLNNLIIFDILNIAINNSDNDLILEIITDSCVINTEIISLLINYYNCEKTTLLADNICRCCNQQIIYNIIKKDNQINILNLISAKILDVNYRYDNGLIIDKKEILIIKNKFEELHKLLNDFDFNIIIDGGNIGFLNAKNSGEININFLKSIINEIINKTNNYVLLIIHNRHQSKIKQLKINNKFLKIFFTPSNLNDDLFWLYATIFSKAYILTNDQCRDNSCMIGYQNEIKQFLTYYQIKLNTDLKLPHIINKKLIPINTIFIDNKIHIKLDSNNLICI